MSSKLCLSAAVVISFLAIGCGRGTTHNVAEQHAAKIDEVMSQPTTGDVSLPGVTKGSMPEGCYLRAVIDGKKWEATEMTPDRSQRSIIPVSGKSGSSSITFVIGGNRANVGQPSKLSDSNQITFWGGEDYFVGAETGQFNVTKMDDQFIEGTFEFTAEKEGKKVTCTNGEFRIPSPTVSPAN